MDNKLYRTENGGINWQYLSYSKRFIKLSDDGIFVTGSCSYSGCEVSTSQDKGLSFQVIGEVQMDGNFFRASLTNNNLYVFSDDVFNNDRVYGINISNGESIEIGYSNLIFTENQYAMYEYGTLMVSVGGEGSLMVSEYLSTLIDKYNWNNYTFYSVDGYEYFVVSDGVKTLVTNYDLGTGAEWREIYDKEQNGFNNTFYKIIVIDNHSFYVGGDNGLLWKADLW